MARLSSSATCAWVLRASIWACRASSWGGRCCLRAALARNSSSPRVFSRQDWMLRVLSSQLTLSRNSTCFTRYSFSLERVLRSRASSWFCLSTSCSCRASCRRSCSAFLLRSFSSSQWALNRSHSPSLTSICVSSISTLSELALSSLALCRSVFLRWQWLPCRGLGSFSNWNEWLAFSSREKPSSWIWEMASWSMRAAFLMNWEERESLLEWWERLESVEGLRSEGCLRKRRCWGVVCWGAFLAVLSRLVINCSFIFMFYLPTTLTHFRTMSQDPKASQDPSQDRIEPSSCSRRMTVVWAILVGLTGVTVAAMAVLLLVSTSKYFSRVFGVLADETLSKQYLKQHYRAYLTTVYLSALGLIIVAADTVLYFLRFSQKRKLLCMHLCFAALLVTSGSVTLTDYDYQSHMSQLQGLTSSDPSCSAAGYANECELASDYEDYRQQMLVFVVVSSIFFTAYAVVYHCGVVCTAPESAQEGRHPEPVGQETFVSQAFDDYQT